MNILLVEDDPGIGRFVHRGLTAEGHAVEWLRSGAEARARLALTAFDAMILDLGLPDMDGTELCADLRRSGSDLPICMLTARATLEEKLEGFRAGADDYLAKPFAFAELLARLDALARRPRMGGELSVGALRIDPARRRAWIGEASIGLSGRTFDLALVLAEQAGATVTRGTLIERVWGDEADVTENVVDVYVGYLRRHLRGQPGAPLIATVRGVGFALRPPPEA